MKGRVEVPPGAGRILHTLEEAGYEAYAVGGCVRDSLLGKEPHDWDITTSAMPQEVKKLFRRTVDTGIQHGTVTVMLKDTGYEVTTYRVDGEYHDHRRPDSVQFTRSLEEDLKRRDFTINAMAYNEFAGLIDLFHGQEDLEKKVIRCVGDPEERFQEDALRILRAVRFAAQLGFHIEEKTAAAASDHASMLKAVSAERIETELTKLLCSDHPEVLAEAYRLGITGVVLPEFDRLMATPQHTPYHQYDVGGHTIQVIRHVPPEKTLRWAALLHDSGKPDCRTTDEKGQDHFKGHAKVSEQIAARVLKRLKMDNRTIRDVRTLVLWHDYDLDGKATEKSFRKAMSRMGFEYFDDLVKLKRADIEGQSEAYREESLENLAHLEEMAQKIRQDRDALKIQDLAVSGKDLIAEGIAKPGPDMGKLLKSLLEEVLEDPSLNERDRLLEAARQKMAEQTVVKGENPVI